MDINERPDIIEAVGNNGEKIQFEIVKVVVYNEKNYAILCPLQKIEGLDEDSCVIFEMKDIDEESVDLIPVEDEAILDGVYALYVEWAESVDKQGCNGNCSGCAGCSD